MSDSLSYIDSYFSGELQTPERTAFEERCTSDPVFAEEVAFYISARDGLKKELYEQKKDEFAVLHARLSSNKAPGGAIVRKMLPYASAAAACLILFLGYQLFFTTPSAQKLADQYIKSDLAVLSKTMGRTDSVQLGVSAYNQKQFVQAERIFKALESKNMVNAIGSGEANHLEAIEYLGIIYLNTGRYDEALIQFDKLAGIELAANRGPFYKAVTLMKRSANGDLPRAKKLLEVVRDKDLPGSKVATEWLKYM